MRPIRLLILAVLFPAWPALAHDYWMLPSPQVLPGGGEVSISLHVGQGLRSEEERPFQKARFPALALLHAGKRDDLLGTVAEGALPMLRLPLPGEGGYLLAGDRGAAFIEMNAKEFEEYLQHEGLGFISAERARAGESDKPAKERYTRHLKALVQVGGARDDTFGAVTGGTLELVPEANPVFVEPGPGRTLPVRVLFRGQPLAAARVEAFSQDGGDIRGASYTSDAAGRIQVAVDRRGSWLLRMVHMVRCEACPDADWESFWTSYTFATANAGASNPRPWPLIAAVAGLSAVVLAILVRRRRAGGAPPG